MKTAILILALLGVGANDGRPCRYCAGSGFRKTEVWRLWFLVRYEFEKCADCDGYGKERTIYGELLKETGLRERR